MTLTVYRKPRKETSYSAPIRKAPVRVEDAAHHLQVGYADLVEAHCQPGDIATNYGSEPFAAEAFLAKVESAANSSYVFTDDSYTYIPSALCVNDGWILLQESKPIAAGEIDIGEEAPVAPKA